MSKIGSVTRVLGMLFLYFVIILGIQVVIKDPLVATSIGNIVITVIVMLYTHKNIKLKPMDRGRLTRSEICLMIIVFCVIFILGQFTGTWVYTLGDSAFNKYQSVFTANPGLAVLVSLVLAPIAEEMLMRKFVYSVLRESFGAWIALITQAILFALMHGTFVHLYATFSMALFLGYVYERTGRIKNTIIFHILYNGFSGLIGGVFIPSGLLVPQFLIPADLGCLWVIWSMFRDCLTLSTDKREVINQNTGLAIGDSVIQEEREYGKKENSKKEND